MIPGMGLKCIFFSFLTWGDFYIRNYFKTYYCSTSTPDYFNKKTGKN